MQLMQYEALFIVQPGHLLSIIMEQREAWVYW